MGNVVSAQGVSVRRGGNDIVSDVSWRVNEGEHWVILGPNGAGKTTLAQVVSGRMHPTRGIVEILGERLGRVDVAQLRPLVGLSSAAVDAKIPPAERVLDVVRTAAYGMSGTWRERYTAHDTQRAYQLLAGLGMQGIEDRAFSSLSTGEKKRAGIARALMSNPEVLVLDEPASGLDLGGRENLLVTLTHLVNSPYAPVLLMVTHHVEEIPQGFTHALLMDHGRVFAQGEIESVITSENLSELFGLPIVVESKEGRFSARAAV